MLAQCSNFCKQANSAPQKLAKHKRRAGKRRREGAGKPCRENGRTLIPQLPENNMVKMSTSFFVSSQGLLKIRCRYLALDFTLNRISGSKWPTEKAGRAAGRDSQIFVCQLARCRSAEDAVLCPSDMMLCIISYWVLSGANRRQIQQLRCCVLPTKLLKRRLEKSFIVRLFTYNAFSYFCNHVTLKR